MARPPILSGVSCFHCGSGETSKAGIPKGIQRYRCRACGKLFIDPEERQTRPERKRRVGQANLPSAGTLVLKLRSIAVRFGRAPTTLEITRLSKTGRSYPLHHYYYVFGSYLAALKKAGIKARYRQEFDEKEQERMLDELRALSRRLKRPLYGRDFPKAREKGFVSPINHFHIAFGSVPNAIELAGVAPKKTYTRDEMITALRKLDAKLDRPVERKDIREANHKGECPSENVIVREFGSLRKARVLAGIRRSYEKRRHRTIHWQKYTKEELIAQLKALAKQIGRQPTHKDINRASREGNCASATTYARMFGSLPEALHAAGFHEIPKTSRRHTNKEILDALLNLKKELGHFPGWHDITAASRAGKCPSNNTIARRLGSLTKLKKKYGE